MRIVFSCVCVCVCVCEQVDPPEEFQQQVDLLSRLRTKGTSLATSKQLFIGETGFCCVSVLFM